MSELLNDDLELDEEIEAGEGDKPNPVREARLKARRAEKKLKELQAELDELKEFRAQSEATSRSATIAKTFQDLTLPEDYADLYPKDAEATPEAIKAFALRYRWLEEAPDEQEAAEQTTQTFSPVQIQGTSPVQKQITVDDLNKLIAAGRDAEAKKAIDEGRVTDLNTDW